MLSDRIKALVAVTTQNFYHLSIPVGIIGVTFYFFEPIRFRSISYVFFAIFFTEVLLKVYSVASARRSRRARG